MSKVIFIVGGTRSGKSEVAEQMIPAEKPAIYLATADPSESNMTERIDVHQKRRPSQWRTLEVPLQINIEVLDKEVQEMHGHYLLLDCLTVFSSNHLFQQTNGMRTGYSNYVFSVVKSVNEQLERLITYVRKANITLIIVASEVGMGLASAYELSNAFADVAGMVNRQMALWADEVYMVQLGIARKIK